MKQRGLFPRCSKNSTLNKTQGWEEMGGGGRRWEEPVGGLCGASGVHACMCGCEYIPLKKVQ